MEAIASSARRYRELYDKAISISEDKTVDGESRIYALTTAAEFQRQLIFFLVDSPNKITQLSGYSRSLEGAVKKLEERKGGGGMNIRLIKDPKSQLPLHYEAVMPSNNNNNGENEITK